MPGRATDANYLYIYTTPADSVVTLKPDSSAGITGEPCEHNGRGDAHRLEIPYDTGGEGAELGVHKDGYVSVHLRGILTASNGAATLNVDDFHLTEAPVVPPPTPEPEPPDYHGTPEEIINQVYAATHPNLQTIQGCGVFTEDCCVALHDNNSAMWGHIKKNPGQNQYNGHAVDALMCLAGEYHGIWDIIVSSASPSAHPAFNRAGDIDPALWYYPA